MSSKGNAGSSNSANQACAACRHQRRKCHNCPLAPFFPPNRTQQFRNVHKLFGVSNVMKILNSIDREMWPAAMETIQFEADARINDPVHGCLGIINGLNAQIEAFTKQLEIVNYQRLYLQRRDQLKQKHQQLQQRHLQNMLPLQRPLLGDYQFQSQNLIELANEPLHMEQMKGIAYSQPLHMEQMKGIAYSQPLQEYADLKPYLRMKQPTVDNEGQESSAESAVRETPSLNCPSNMMKNENQKIHHPNTMKMKNETGKIHHQNGISKKEKQPLEN